MGVQSIGSGGMGMTYQKHAEVSAKMVI